MRFLSINVLLQNKWAQDPLRHIILIWLAYHYTTLCGFEKVSRLGFFPDIFSEKKMNKKVLFSALRIYFKNRLISFLINYKCMYVKGIYN